MRPPPMAGPEVRHHTIISPLDCTEVATVRLASPAELVRRLDEFAAQPFVATPGEIFAFLHRLAAQMQARRDIFLDLTMRETGFIAGDCVEIVDGALDFLRGFETYQSTQFAAPRLVRHSYSGDSARDIRITTRPLRCVAAVVPQNASLTLAVTILVSALAAGSRALIRPSLQSGASGTLLSEAIEASDPPRHAVAVLNCFAEDFLAACCASPTVELIHYIGGQQHALPSFLRAFAAGKHCLLDGQGNGLLYVDEGFPLDEAVALIVGAVTRFNGETCTSVNGVLAHPSLHGPLREALRDSFAALRIGSPRDADTHVGPLFSERQAIELCANWSDGATALAGGARAGAYVQPALIEGVVRGSALAREGLFGPAAWLARADAAEAALWLRDNRYPLSDTVLSHRDATLDMFAGESRAPRLCVNADPSVESVFEPWGGHPPSGLNPVSVWTAKYVQTYMVDGRLDTIMRLRAGASREAA